MESTFQSGLHLDRALSTPGFPAAGLESLLGTQVGLTISALKGVGHLKDGLHRLG